MTSSIVKDFQPINTWKLEENGLKWKRTDIPRHIIDQTTGNMYWNESKAIISYKCFLLTLGTPIVHFTTALVYVACKVAKLVSFSHFWVNKEGETSYSFQERLKDAGKDLLKVVATPFAVLGLQWAAVYGIFNPLDGRKLYATIERVQYGTFILAPCFQPNATCHAFGGDPEKRNAF